MPTVPRKRETLTYASPDLIRESMVAILGSTGYGMQTLLAEKLGVDRGTVAAWLYGEQPVSKVVALALWALWYQASMVDRTGPVMSEPEGVAFVPTGEAKTVGMRDSGVPDTRITHLRHRTDF